jgi:hypothetical protein
MPREAADLGTDSALLGASSNAVSWFEVSSAGGTIRRLRLDYSLPHIGWCRDGREVGEKGSRKEEEDSGGADLPTLSFHLFDFGTSQQPSNLTSRSFSPIHHGDWTVRFATEAKVHR